MDRFSFSDRFDSGERLLGSNVRFTLEAEICGAITHVRFGPEAELDTHNCRPCSRSLDLAHIPMVYGGHMTIVPGNRDCIPTLGDNAAVIGIG